MGKYKRFDIIEKMDTGELSVWTVELPVTFFNKYLDEGCSVCGTSEEIMNDLKQDEYLMGKVAIEKGHGDYLVKMCCALGISCGIGPMQRCNPCPLSHAQLPDRFTEDASEQACIAYVRRHPEIIPMLEDYVKAEDVTVE